MSKARARSDNWAAKAGGTPVSPQGENLVAALVASQNHQEDTLEGDHRPDSE